MYILDILYVHCIPNIKENYFLLQLIVLPFKKKINILRKAAKKNYFLNCSAIKGIRGGKGLFFYFFYSVISICTQLLMLYI